MAKKRRVNGRGSVDRVAAPTVSATADRRGVDPLSIALGVLAGTIVYVLYFPSDSVAVETGDALWFCLLAIIIATITIGGSLLGKKVLGTEVTVPPRDPSTESRSEDYAVTATTPTKITSRRFFDTVLWVAPWLLATWMMVAAVGTSPPGNLRMATNEAWLWVAAAAVFTAARRLLVDLDRRRAVMLLITACVCGLAVHGLHQQFVSLPQTRIEYRSDPDKMLTDAGFDAPAGSAERMMFENRLFDGGPSGTFALANSLAALLLVGAICSLGVLRLRWSQLPNIARIAWAVASMLCVACLIAARSRSATLTLLLSVVLLFIAGLRVSQARPRQAIIGLAVILGLGLAAAIGLAVLGNPEWFEAAPASLAFRFQYWRATVAMVLDRPLFGAGPGNFQSIYERYREPSATEQIAEPHNFLFETWASGGFVGLTILICVIIAGLAVMWTRGNRPGRVMDAESPVDCGDAVSGDTQWLALGAGLGLAMVWLIGLATRVLPDFQAHALAVPVSLILAVLLWPSMRRLPHADFDLIGSVALSALMIHLLVSGGWTVPGVAIVAWLLFAALTRATDTNSAVADNDSRTDHAWLTPARRRLAGVLVIAAGVILTSSIYLLSVRPVESQSRAISRAGYFQSTGRIGRAEASLKQAVEADRWSPDAAIMLADYHRWRLILERESTAVRRDWEAAIALAKQRAGDDPAIYRAFGAQQLHVYQRYAGPADLRDAAKTFRQATTWSPSSEWLAAQSAAIAAAQGDVDRANQLASRAKELSLLGGNIERSLDRQQIYVVDNLGLSVRTGPIRRPASELLANQCGPDSVTRQ
jgi:hypothetical protein